MRLLRRLILGASGALLAAGCGQEGDFEVSWQFMDAGGAVQSADDGCGAHGVDAILVTGSSGSDTTSAIGLCTPGSLRHRVPAGTWTLQIHTLDAQGRTIQPIDAPEATTDALAVKEDGLTPFPIVSITPRPACGDGVDNDRDGLVDLADPDCAGNAAWTDEASPSEP